MRAMTVPSRSGIGRMGSALRHWLVTKPLLVVSLSGKTRSSRGAMTAMSRFGASANAASVLSPMIFSHSSARLLYYSKLTSIFIVSCQFSQFVLRYPLHINRGFLSIQNEIYRNAIHEESGKGIEARYGMRVTSETTCRKKITKH